MAPYKALYGRPCRSLICLTEVGERSIKGPNLIRDTSKKVDLIAEAYSHGSKPTEELHLQTTSTYRV